MDERWEIETVLAAERALVEPNSSMTAWKYYQMLLELYYRGIETWLEE